MNKNDEFEIEITDMGNDGEGIGHYDGMAFFIKGAVIGDKVLAGATKLKKTYGYARVVKILQPSPFRVETLCPVASKCGGCQIQQLDYNKQLEYKENKVKELLTRIGGVCFGAEGKNAEFMPIIGMEEPFHYRNKAQFPVGIDKNGNIVAGFYAGHTHSVIDTASCPIQHELTDDLMAAVREYMKENGVMPYAEEKRNGLVRHVLTRVGFITHQVMVCMIINGKKLPVAEKLQAKLEAAVAAYNEKMQQTPAYELASFSLNINTENTNVIMGTEMVNIYGPGYITDYIGDVCYRISPLSFYQVNPEQTKKLYSTALEYTGLSGSETVWDLYCGIGTISLFLARNAKHVYGVEIVPQAIEDAIENAKLNSIDNADFFVGAAEEILPAKYRENPEMYADVIVVDPPRKGCEESLLECMCQLAPKKIVYVSCDPATLSRDVKYLTENGYEVKKVQSVDMFPHSLHVETVCLLSKLHEAKHHVSVTLDMDEMDITSAESKATYEEIKKYVAEHNDGMKVSNLYIAQVKRKCGLELAENFNLPKSEDSKQPQCPKEKEKAIMEALKAFQMI